MLKKTITYEDYNGNEYTEDFYFNLSKTELLEMETSVTEGMTVMLQDIVKAGKAHDMLQVYKNIILSSFGTKSEDGKRFIKSKEAAAAFVESPAFDELFVSLASDADIAAEFVNGIIPRALAEQVKTLTAAEIVEEDSN